MSTARPLADPVPAWQQELAQGYTRVDELLAALGLDASLHAPPAAASAGFPLRVPRSFVARMRRGDPRDPLLLQVMPGAAELVDAAGFVSDPVGDLDAVRAPGLLQKYAGRALVIATGACAVHCRYCFRREFPYAGHHGANARPAALAAALAAAPEIEEVILSGGDPLSLGDRRLGELLGAIDAVASVRRIRIHTRLPVVLPARVTGELLDCISSLRRPVVVVLHCNHAREIDAAVVRAARQLAGPAALLLNQSVLLRGVNDSVAALAALSGRLFEAGVMPYYLHQLDAVRGAAHFAVPDDEARALVSGLAAQLPGYLVPKLVREVAGAPAKQPLA